MIREDELLGRVRECPQCKEEWPWDSEFWHISDGEFHGAWPHRCIACCADYFADRRRVAMTIRRSDREIHHPPADRCGQELTGGQFCGRAVGHNYGHRSWRAMKEEAARKKGWIAA